MGDFKETISSSTTEMIHTWSTGIARMQGNKPRLKSDGVSGLKGGVDMVSVKKLSTINTCCKGGGVCSRCLT